MDQVRIVDAILYRDVVRENKCLSFVHRDAKARHGGLHQTAQCIAASGGDPQGRVDLLTTSALDQLTESPRGRGSGKRTASRGFWGGVRAQTRPNS
jgi:hypothetical protein